MQISHAPFLPGKSAFFSATKMQTGHSRGVLLPNFSPSTTSSSTYFSGEEGNGPTRLLSHPVSRTLSKKGANLITPGHGQNAATKVKATSDFRESLGGSLSEEELRDRYYEYWERKQVRKVVMNEELESDGRSEQRVHRPSSYRATYELSPLHLSTAVRYFCISPLSHQRSSRCALVVTTWQKSLQSTFDFRTFSFGKKTHVPKTFCLFNLFHVTRSQYFT